MKKTKRFLSVLLVIVMAVSFGISAFAAGAGTTVYTKTEKISDDLTYYDIVSYDDTSRVESYLLEDRPGGEVFPIILSGDTIYGGDTLTSIVKYAEGLGYHVLGAINADFYATYHIPMGAVIENGILKSSPEGRNLLAINSDGSYSVIENPQLALTLTNQNTGTILPLDHLNKARVDVGGIYVYSEYYSAVSTRTSTDGVSVRLQVTSGNEITASSTLTATVTDIFSGTDAAAIGEDCIVLSAATASGKTADLLSLNVGDTVTLTSSLSGGDLSRAVWATGAGDVLASGGKLTESSAWDSAISGTNPRTVMGIKADGTAVYYVVDGRHTSHSCGLSFTKAAEELINRGCKTVLAFDGGGSSAMAVRLPGQSTASLVSSPSDGQERTCANYILLVTNQTGSSLKRLSLKQNGAVVLQGTTIELSALATTTGFSPASTPKEVTYSAKYGQISGNQYYASSVGTDTITLSGGGIVGTATITVVDSLTGLDVQDLSGATISLLRLEVEEGLRMSAVGTYYGIPVNMDTSSIKFKLEGDVGTLTGDASTVLYTAYGAPGATGVLNVSGGGKTISLPITIKADFKDTKNHWSRKYVMALYDIGVVNGLTATTFGPDNQIKRGDFILMLYRAAGCPEIGEGITFTDVSDSAYYAAAISWAAEEGIALGTGDGNFEPKATLTREQAFTFVYRALNTLGVSCEDADIEILREFDDADSIAKYAVTPAATLVQQGIVGGAYGKLNPDGELTRGQMAKILCVAMDVTPVTE